MALSAACLGMRRGIVPRGAMRERRSPEREAKPLGDRSGVPPAATAVILGRVGLPRPSTGYRQTPTMTDDTMALDGLVDKSSAADLLREMIGFVAERLMELEAAGLTGTAPWRA